VHSHGAESPCPDPHADAELRSIKESFRIDWVLRETSPPGPIGVNLFSQGFEITNEYVSTTQELGHWTETADFKREFDFPLKR
jgi:hypothetical protein